MPGMSTPKAHAQGAREEEGTFFFGALCLAHWHGDLSSTPSPSRVGFGFVDRNQSKKKQMAGGERKPRRKGRGGGLRGNARAFNGRTPYNKKGPRTTTNLPAPPPP